MTSGIQLTLSSFGLETSNVPVKVEIFDHNLQRREHDWLGAKDSRLYEFALAELRPMWEREVREANLDPGFGLEPKDDVEPEEEDFGGEDLPDVVALSDSQFEGDNSEANGSSIAFIAEFDGRRVLFAADAHAEKLVTSLDRLSPDKRVALDLFKISHHGSKNTTSSNLIEKVDCQSYLFSTNGSIYKHPHGEAVARVLTSAGGEPMLIFNYRSASNQIWGLDSLKTRHNYHTRYPAEGQEGIDIEL